MRAASAAFFIAVALTFGACGGDDPTQADLLRVAEHHCPQGIDHVEFDEYGKPQILELVCADQP